MSVLVNGVAPPAAPNENHFIFEEDEVSRLTDGTKQYGLVIETSEFVSSDDEDYNEEDEEERVKKGSVRVAWYPEGEEQVIEEKTLNLEDRSLMPGDVVRRLISGTNSQRGFVKDMRVLCDVQVIGTDRVIRGVDAKKLLRAEEWEGESQFVSLDSWVGRVEGVSTDIIVRFPDNSTMELMTVDMVSDAFNDVTDSKRGEDSEFRSKVFYEGQVLEETYRNIMEHDHEWITESKTYGRHHSKNCTKKVKMVVEEVNTRQLDIHWMCRGYAETEVPTAKLQMPLRTVEFEQMTKLKRLDYFEHCTVQIGDRAYLMKELTVEKQDTTNNNFTEGDASKEEKTVNKNENTNKNDADDDETGCCEGADKVEKSPKKGSSKNANGTDDGEDADWETGSECEDQCHEKPKRKRTYSGSKHKAHGARTPQKRRRHRSKRLKWPERVPVEVLHTESYVDIMWQDGTVEEGIPSLDLYPIHHLDELEFFPGDFVIRSDSSKDEYGVVSSVDHQARTCWVKWVQPYVCGVSTKPVEGELVEVSVYDVKDHPDYKFRPDQIIVRVCCDEKTPECKEAAGQIVDIEPSGELLVCWADGTKSKAYPQDVFLISDETSDYGSSEWGSDEDEDESVCSWETEEEETETESEKEEGAEGEDPDVKPKKKKKEDETETPKSGGDVGELMNLVVGDKMELDYQLDRLETALDNPYGIQPEVNERVVDCYRNVLTAYKQCIELDRLLGSAHFQDEELKSLISQVKKELRKEKQNRIQNQLLQQAQSCMNARKGSTDNVDGVKSEADGVDGAVGGAVPKAKSEPNIQSPARAPSLVIVKHSTDDSTVNVETVSDVNAELTATLDRARGVCTSVLKALRKQVGKVREHLEGLYQKKLELMKEQEEKEEKEELETASAQSVPEMMSPLSPDQSRFMPVFEERFVMTDTEPNQHNFFSREHTPQDAKTFSSAVRKEMKLLRSNLPAGIRVVGFEERMDLYSVLVVGPSCTPYEDGLFFFDVQLPNSYPAAPPTFHYISYCSDRLNPNLYDDGKVCVSLLGTWGGRGTELWSASSNMLQVLVSIQGLILNSEPYYNEAGYEKQRGSQMGMENSKVYNEMAILKLVQSMIKIIKNPPLVFKVEVAEHMKKNAERMIQRLESWIQLSEQFASSKSLKEDSESSQIEASAQKPPANPDFPLIPASRGFCLTLKTHLNEFKNVLITEGLISL